MAQTKISTRSFPTHCGISKCCQCWSTRSRQNYSIQRSAGRCRRSASRKASRSIRMKRRRPCCRKRRGSAAPSLAPTPTPTPATKYFYPNRKWQDASGDLSYTFAKDGVPQIDPRNNVYYMAAGNSPAMMEKHVGQGSQYLWTYRDTSGAFLDGAKTYRLRVLPNIPAKNFWSVVVYDSLSRSELQNGQPLPSVSSYTKPKLNADGTIDIIFGPDAPNDGGNWIRTVPGRGWFPIFRFYSPTEAYFDKTWVLNDIEPL